MERITSSYHEVAVWILAQKNEASAPSSAPRCPPSLALKAKKSNWKAE
jgi:hypothetical protein